MKICKNLQPNDIDALRKMVIEENSHDNGDILESLDKSFCYEICIFSNDFDGILVNSSIENRDLKQSEYPSIREVIERIKDNPSFLSQTNGNRRLDGKTVRRYYDEFKRNGNKPNRFFLVDRDFYPQINPKGLLYIRDGMHHLVAYGLAVDMTEDAFPIIGYYSTNKKHA